MIDQDILSISSLNHLIQQHLEYDGLFDNLSLSAELTQVRPYHMGKQVYCYLSDGKSSINAVLYASTLKRLDFELKEGLTVFVKASLNFYAKRGSVMLQINYMSLSGEGLIKQQLAALKAKLSKEGLFDLNRKKALPKYPQQIAMITAFDSAAMWDFTKRVKKHAGHLSLSIIPATMQGSQAVDSICMALDRAEKRKNIDILIISRGGGSNQDLAVFNEERLLRKIATSSLFIVSAIGHDIDHSLCDEIADVSVATPTAAADLILAPFLDVRKRISQELLPLGVHLCQHLRHEKQRLKSRMKDGQDHLNFLLHRCKDRYHFALKKIESANPLKRLSQGFCVCTHAKSNILIDSVKKLKNGQEFQLRFHDGEAKIKTL